MNEHCLASILEPKDPKVGVVFPRCLLELDLG